MTYSGCRTVRAPVALLALVTLVGVAFSPAVAQLADSTWTRSSSPALVKYGKWVTLAAAIGMGIKAANAHDAADRWFNRLERYCEADIQRCDQTAGGTYVDPTAERYYQRSLHHDRSARRWLLGGEVALIGTAGLFVWELTRPRRLPENIPFEPEIRVWPQVTQVGFRVSF